MGSLSRATSAESIRSHTSSHVLSRASSHHSTLPVPSEETTTHSNRSSTGPPSITSPTHRQKRNVRGRPVTSSRQISSSNADSISPAADRASITTPAPGPARIGTIGICALDKKARSKPSRNILNRLNNGDEFDVIIFGDHVILDTDVEDWPVCDFLISFFSDGFPLDKAIAYVKLRRPFCVNDLPMQSVLWDRRMCLMILDKIGVPTPPRLEVNRDGGPIAISSEAAQRMKQLTSVELVGSDDGRGGGLSPPRDVHMEDDDDTLVVDGKRLTKPFVEKPVSGEDHNINIYYPKSQGGGGRRLFRKVNNKSSEKDDRLTLPRAITNQEESYIYEQFLQVENAEDVKAYTVGPDYCHAETRKSPVVDGLVKRNPNGKEIRYVTPLTKEEQLMASNIAVKFGQRVCGFDLLRAGDKSYVIDVNGWSFVKDNEEYYQQSARILRDLFTRERMKWDGRATPTELDDPQSNMFASTTSLDKTAGPIRKRTFSRDKDGAGGTHRNALKSVFRSRSISRVREGVNHAAHRVGHGHLHPESNSTPQVQRTLSFSKRSRTVPPAHLQSTSLPVGLDGQRSSEPGTDELDSRPSFDPLDPADPSEAPSRFPAPASKSQWKLKGMVAVVRHADRTPKQKFKFNFHSPPFVSLLKGHQEEVLLVGEAALKSVQLAVQQAMKEDLEDKAKLTQLANALAKKGSWPGTKVQIKPMFRKPKSAKANATKEDGKVKSDAKSGKESIPLVNEPTAGVASQVVSGAGIPTEAVVSDHEAHRPEQHRAQTRSDSVPEITMSRAAAAEQNMVLDKLQLVMKWGGEPTHSARYQAADLGEDMRNDLLLLNREVLNDVSIFSSSERRVKTSAQIFGAAFLDLKDLDEDHIHVRKDLLDDSNAAKDEMDKVKKQLKTLLRKGQQAPEQFTWPKDGVPEPYLVARRVVELMRFHRRVMHHNFAALQAANAAAAAAGDDAEDHIASIQTRWCIGEDPDLFRERWEKLFSEFTDPEKVDPSKISELYDTMKFDALHNRPFLERIFTPSLDLISDEGEHGSNALTKTVSSIAREEFGHTHKGETPANQGDKPKSFSRRTSTTESNATNVASQDPPPKEKLTFSQRLGFRRRSADASTMGNHVPGASDDPANSYFALYRGNSVEHSKTKNDERLEKLTEMYSLTKILFDFIGPQEYGITDSEKLEIGLLTSLPLLKEIVKDLEEVQASEDARSFIYFTKESHIYTLLNCIIEGGVQTKIARNAIPELDYLSQICFELYESANAESDRDPDNPHLDFNYSIRITISPGCHVFDPLDVQLDSKHCIGCAPRRGLTPHRDWKAILETLRAKFNTVKLPKSFTAVNLSEKHPQEFPDGMDKPGGENPFAEKVDERGDGVTRDARGSGDDAEGIPPKP